MISEKMEKKHKKVEILTGSHIFLSPLNHIDVFNNHVELITIFENKL